MSTVEIRPFQDGDARDIARLSTTVQWPSLTDPEVVRRVCTAPGASSYVARTDGRLVGWAQALGDGVLQSHLVTESAEALFTGFEHTRMAGFRIYPGA